ncbi:MAG TPA: sigma-70 family RNA polymerase sigma factor [Solirubrobacteraceae bacterium]|nr:sigma-70 family RNA polymerase sigma factor [Solirubrobacteraceae bacterium]
MATPQPFRIAGAGPQHRCGPARHRLIEAHLPLVRALALRFARRGEPLEDLIQVGCIGLIHAVDRYDPRRGESFEAYAVPTITGAIRHHLRDDCAALRVPRRVAEENARVYRVRAELEARTGRPASLAELAHAADVALSTVAGALDPPRVEPLGEEDGPPADPISDVDERLALEAALRALPARERRILLLSFYGERSQRGIAHEVGLSQIHVSRVLRGALERLRPLLEDGIPVAGPVREA